MYKTISFILMVFIAFSCNNPKTSQPSKPVVEAPKNLQEKTPDDMKPPAIVPDRADGDAGVKASAPDKDGFVLVNVHPTTAVELVASRTVQLLDVRTYQEQVDQPRIPGARHFDFYKSNFRENLKKLNPSQAHLVYCKSGVRSAKACKILYEMGISQVYNLEGGYDNYMRMGY